MMRASTMKGSGVTVAGRNSRHITARRGFVLTGAFGYGWRRAIVVGVRERR